MSSLTPDALTAALIEATLLGLAAITISVLVFDNYRRQYPVIFEYRHHLHEVGLRRDASKRRVYAPPNPPRARFGWFTPTISHELRALARTHGPDTALHLRLLRLHILLFGICTCFVALPLSILYATALTQRPSASGIARIGATEITTNTRYWAAASLQLLCTLTVVVLLHIETRIYRELIARSRTGRQPCNYALLVTCAPRGASFDFVDSVTVLPIQSAKSVSIARIAYRRALRARERAEALDTDEAENANNHELDELRNTELQLENELRNVITTTTTSDSATSARAAVIIYPTRTATTATLSEDERVKPWGIIRAPEPDAVDWKSLMGMPELARSRAFAACVPLFLATLLGIIVAAAVEGFVRLETVTRIRIAGVTPLRFAAPVARIHFVGGGIIQGILPAALLAISLAPMSGFARKIALVFRTPTKQRRDSIARTALLLLSVWSIVVARFGMAVLYEIAAKKPNIAYNQLIAEISASHGWFACVFIMLKGTLSASGSLLMIRRVQGRNRRLKRAVTPRDFREADDWRANFTYVDAYAEAQLVAIIGLMYAPVTPIVLVIALFWHLVHFPPAKYQLCYACREIYDGAGEMFPAAIWCLIGAAFVGHAGLAGFLGLRLAIGPAVVAGLPLVGLPFVCWWIARRLRMVVDNDDVESVGGDGGEVDKEIVELAQSVYVQPELRPVENEKLDSIEVERRSTSSLVERKRVKVKKDIETDHTTVTNTTATTIPEEKVSSIRGGFTSWAFGWAKGGGGGGTSIRDDEDLARNSSIEWADAPSK